MGVGVSVPGEAAPRGVRATARIAARPDGRGGTSLPVLEGEGPLALRRIRGGAAEARVMLVGAMSGPLGGDRLAVEADVAEGARLRVGSAAATIALPGPRKGEARYDVRITVADRGELHWTPEQLICAGGSELYVTTTVDLAATARLVLREEQVLGRAGEEPGRLGSRLAVRIAGRRVLDQELALGPGAPAAGTARPGSRDTAPSASCSSYGRSSGGAPCGARAGEGAAVLPLAGPAALVTAVAPDALRLRRLLDEGLARLDGPTAG